MNSWLILLLLLLGGQNGCDDPVECGCGEERGRNSGDCGCGGERDQNGNDCGCADVNESRFEPRFESGPFGSPGCGCSGQ